MAVYSPDNSQSNNKFLNTPNAAPVDPYGTGMVNNIGWGTGMPYGTVGGSASQQPGAYMSALLSGDNNLSGVLGNDSYSGSGIASNTASTAGLPNYSLPTSSLSGLLGGTGATIGSNLPTQSFNPTDTTANYSVSNPAAPIQLSGSTSPTSSTGASSIAGGSTQPLNSSQSPLYQLLMNQQLGSGNNSTYSPY